MASRKCSVPTLLVRFRASPMRRIGAQMHRFSKPRKLPDNHRSIRQILTVPSRPPDANSEPSWLNAME